MGLINHIKDIFDDDKHLEENPFFSLLIFTPASIISSVISIPLTIIGIISIPFGKTVQKFSTKILLYIQHGISMGHLYYLEEYIFDTLEYQDIVIGGALGNFYDRIIYNAVPDFIDLHYKTFHWFTFNVADIFITFGVLAMIFKEFLVKNK